MRRALAAFASRGVSHDSRRGEGRRRRRRGGRRLSPAPGGIASSRSRSLRKSCGARITGVVVGWHQPPSPQRPPDRERRRRPAPRQRQRDPRAGECPRVPRHRGHRPVSWGRRRSRSARGHAPSAGHWTSSKSASRTLAEQTSWTSVTLRFETTTRPMAWWSSGLKQAPPHTRPVLRVNGSPAIHGSTRTAHCTARRDRRRPSRRVQYDCSYHHTPYRLQFRHRRMARNSGPRHVSRAHPHGRGHGRRRACGALPPGLGCGTGSAERGPR